MAAHRFAPRAQPFPHTLVDLCRHRSRRICSRAARENLSHQCTTSTIRGCKASIASAGGNKQALPTASTKQVTNHRPLGSDLLSIFAHTTLSEHGGSTEPEAGARFNESFES